MIEDDFLVRLDGNWYYIPKNDVLTREMCKKEGFEIKEVGDEN